jgi:fatty acid-binding protein DegV
MCVRYLYMGGRIGRAQNLAGTLLNIKPIIGMRDGVIVPLDQLNLLKAQMLSRLNAVEVI